MPSKNVSSAGNQQGRQKLIGWVVGFIDGEGCFSVSINKNSTTSSGWQIFPELVVTQGKKSICSLKELQDFFGCGRIFVNYRHDNHREDLYRFCIRSIDDLHNKVIPFFQKNSLKTAKKEDFQKFTKIVKIMSRKEHLSKKGMEKIAKIVQNMNRKKPSRFLLPSETIR